MLRILQDVFHTGNIGRYYKSVGFCCYNYLENLMTRMLRKINEMHLYVTSHCNMGCLYCSDSTKRAKLTGNQFMKIETAKKFVDLIFSNSKQGYIDVVFHGGEPTLQTLEWYQLLIDHIEHQASNYNIEVKLAMQSNCMAISNEYMDFFKKRKITVGASMDGPPDIHNLTRGKGEEVLANILRLQEVNRLGGVICVITDCNCDEISTILQFFENMGLFSISFNIFYSVGSGNQMPPLSAQKIFDTYRMTYEYMKATAGKKVIERSVSIMLSKYVKPLTKEENLKNLNCYSPFCHAGILNIICDTDGNLFPCGCSDYPKFKLGSVYLLDRDHYLKTLRLLHEKHDNYSQNCNNCFANSICSFSCPAFREEDPVTEKHLCEATKMFYRFLKTEPPEVVAEIAVASNVKHGRKDS